MKRKLMLLFAYLLVGIGLAIAQNNRVNGTVVDETGEPVIGASVVVKGNTSIGTVTDFDGRFSLDIPTSAKILVVKYLGMEDHEIAVAPDMKVTLKISESLLDEIVVVAYGTASKGTYTGAASVVNSTKTLKDLPVTNIESALQGAAAGVNVGVPNGQPGAQAQIRIRGFGSYNADNAPLYVVDGVPVNSGDYALVGYGGSLGILNTLNPSDVENITVLKDAAATSMYGSRGANGVIMITTKKGKKGALQINLKGSWGFNDFAINNRPIASGDENWMLVNEGAYNQSIYNGLGEDAARAYAQQQADKIAPKRDQYSNWIDALTRTGRNENYEISFSGGNENTSFYTSAGYVKDLGVYNDSYLDGFTSKASITHQSGNWKLNFDSNIAKIEQGVTPGIDGDYVAYANPYYASRTYLSPNIPIYNEDGSYYEGDMFTGNYYNLVKDQQKNKATNSIARFMNTLALTYKIIDGLNIKETFSYDYNDIGGISRYPSDSKDGSDFQGSTTKINYKSQRYYSSLMLTYDRTFMDAHTIGLTAAWDTEEDKTEYLGGTGRKFASTNLWELDVAATPNAVSGFHDKDRMESFIGRLNYNFSEKYFLSGTFRRDGSSRFGENTKWGNFWSISGSWRMKNESFIKELSWINDLKLRSSYGISGTRPSSLYSHLATYSYDVAYGDNPASRPSRVANPDLSWEKNAVFDIGVEAYLFDRFSVEVDYYDRQTNDMLLDAPISSITGFGTTLLNIGGMNNRGVELSLGVDVFKGVFNWNSHLNLAHNRNKITKLYNGESIISGNYLIKEGESLYSFRAREWAGVDPGTGESMWYKYDLDEDGEIIKSSKSITKDPNTATRHILGKADPDWTGGWRNTFSWNGFDFDFLFTFSLGGNSWDNGWTMTTDGLYTYPNAISELQLNRWQNPGDMVDFPKRMHGGGHGNYTSSRWMHTTDHLRLKSMSLGYTLPKKWLDPVNLKSVRLFTAGTNLLTFAKYDDYDPETQVNGQSGWAIPALKSITFGIEIGF